MREFNAKEFFAICNPFYYDEISEEDLVDVLVISHNRHYMPGSILEVVSMITNA